MPDAIERIKFMDGSSITSAPSTASYVEFNTDISVTGITEAGATTIVTAAAFTPNGVDSYWIEFFAPGVQPASSLSAQVIICVFDNGSPIAAGTAAIAQVLNPTAAVMVTPVIAKLRVTPTAVSHTYSICAYRQVGNGSVRGTGAGISRPGYVSVTKA